MQIAQLSTWTGLLSTRAVARMQLRDVNFVTHAKHDTYLPTGVETRSPIGCAPAVHTRRWVLRRLDRALPTAARLS